MCHCRPTSMMIYLIAFTVLSASVLSITCPADYTEDQGDCYKIVQSKETYSSASLKCRDEGGKLASIHNAFTNSHLQSMAQQYGIALMWIGLRCATNDPTSCAWDDGSYLNFEMFKPYPDTKLGQCAYLRVTDATWISADCSNGYEQFVCEISGPSTTVNPNTLAPRTCASNQKLYGSGTIYSPGYPDSYTSNVCTYMITENVPSVARIRFPVLNLDATSYIELYNNVDQQPFVVLKGGGFYNPWQWYSSSTNSIDMVFFTTGVSSNSGYKWEAEYEPTNAVYGTTPSSNFCSESGCNAQDLFSSGCIFSLNYPGVYPTYKSCLYNISTTPGQRILLNFEKIDTTTEDAVVVFDSVTVDSNKRTVYSGVYGQTNFTSTGNHVLVVFQTDNRSNQNGAHNGFLAYFSSIWS